MPKPKPAATHTADKPPSPVPAPGRPGPREPDIVVTLDTLSKYYVCGAHLCFVLDRISPTWKTAFFQSQKSRGNDTAGFHPLFSGAGHIWAARGLRDPDNPP